MTTCRLCGADTEARCPTCWPRLTHVSELKADTNLHRQQVLDLDVGPYFGARLILGFIAPAWTHFDLGYALLGEPEYEVVAGTPGDPPIAGPWDAADGEGRSYEGFGRGYTAAVPKVCRGTVRFVRTQPGPPFLRCPSPGPLRLQALRAGAVVLDVVVDVPPPASWEDPI